MQTVRTASTARPVLRTPVRLHAPRSSSACVRVANVTQDTFQTEVMQSELPVMVDFWASWCGPCKLVAPLMDWAEKEYAGSLKVVKVEHDANPKLIEEFKVYGLPALVLIRDGQLVAGSKREGAITKALLLEWLNKHGVAASAKTH